VKELFGEPVKGIGGLSDGAIYYVILDLGGRVKLAESFGDALEGANISLDLDGTTTGKMHSLEIPVEGIGIQAELASHDGSGAVAGIRGGPLLSDALTKGEVTGSIGGIVTELMGRFRDSAKEAGAQDESEAIPINLSMGLAYSRTRTVFWQANDAVRIEMDIGGGPADEEATAVSTLGRWRTRRGYRLLRAVTMICSTIRPAEIASGAKAEAAGDLEVEAQITYPFLFDGNPVFSPDDFNSPTAIGNLLDQKLGLLA
jgi:hypothetical protein